MSSFITIFKLLRKYSAIFKIHANFLYLPFLIKLLYNLYYVNQDILLEDQPHSNAMLSIFRRRIPDGVIASTVSPTFLPMRAAPIGDFREIFPASRFIS